jgi:hypothetical protein
MRTLLHSTLIAAFVAGCSSPDSTSGGLVDSGNSDTGFADSAQTDSAADTAADTTKTDTPWDGTGAGCGDKTCTVDQICTRTYTTGGACEMCGDGGVCPAGRHCSGSAFGGCCVPDVITYGYDCKPAPTGCASAPSCGTCGSACGTGGCPCEGASGTTVTCHCMAP